MWVESKIGTFCFFSGNRMCGSNFIKMMCLNRYVTVLVELARVDGGTEHGGLIAQQMLDVAIRVEAIRPFATRQMVLY